jgi:pseudouridine-5'-phosphate glycosidase
VANPVPEADEIPAAAMAGHIARAVAEAAEGGVAGKAVTPFILSRLVELTAGRSLRTNVALIHSNARLAAAVAVALSAEGQAGAKNPSSTRA